MNTTATTRWRRGLFQPHIAHLPHPDDLRTSRVTYTLCDRYARRCEPAPDDMLRCPDCARLDTEQDDEPSAGGGPGPAASAH